MLLQNVLDIAIPAITFFLMTLVGMDLTAQGLPLPGLDVNAALRSILEGTATETGERFFQALVKNLAKVLNGVKLLMEEHYEQSSESKSCST